MNFSYFVWSFLALLVACGSPADIETAKNAPSASTTSSDPILNGMNQAIFDNPSKLSVRVDRATYLYEQEMYDQALRDVSYALTIDSTDVSLYHLKADIQLDYYQSREAIKTLEKAIALNPGRLPSYLKLAEFHHVLTQYDQSISVVNQVIGKDQQNAEAYFMLGMNFRAMQDLPKAKASFQRAVELDADLTDAWIILGNIYEEAQDPMANQYYQNAVNTAPENVAALHSLAFYLQNHERIIPAIDIYSRINQLDPQYEDAYLNTGILYLSIDSFRLAQEHFNILKKINPANAFAHYYSGLTSELSDNVEAARQSYEIALRLSPNYEKAKLALAELNQSDK